LRYAETNLTPEALETLRNNPGIQIEDLHEDGHDLEILLPNGLGEEEWILRDNEELDTARNEIIGLLLEYGADPLVLRTGVSSAGSALGNAFTIAIQMADLDSFKTLEKWQEQNRVSDKEWMKSLKYPEEKYENSGFLSSLMNMIKSYRLGYDQGQVGKNGYNELAYYLDSIKESMEWDADQEMCDLEESMQNAHLDSRYYGY
jgi:hypothetical protein